MRNAYKFWLEFLKEVTA